MLIRLNRDWTLYYGSRKYPCSVPCSLYDTLIAAGEIPDPYVGENEWETTPLSDTEILLEKRVTLPEDLLRTDRILLRFAGIDTLADILWDGKELGHTDNMHRTWEFPLQEILPQEEHLLQVRLHSPIRYVSRMQEKRPLWGVDSTMPGYPWLRKAHYMFGWDWGPKLPDMGIWRDVTLEGCTGGRILSTRVEQVHGNGCVTLTCIPDLDIWDPEVTVLWTLTAPDGQVFSAPLKDGQAEIRLRDPQLWWVRGLGEQPLYLSRISLCAGPVVLDAQETRIGLRTLSVSREKDAWGEEFCLINNGVKFFAMGADYIPEDQLLPRLRKERTEKLLRDCVRANYNFIRVWGGGIYPDSAFYDFCDEHGLAVWQDFMFACAAYRMTPDFESTVRAEIRDNVLRLRSHPSLALWCGNNEIESAWDHWGLPEDPQARADYLRLFEGIIPEILRQTDPDRFYWPSSPSCGGGFRDPDSGSAGDTHYWAVWHSFRPIEAFREHFFRFCSEYGFESLPDVKTVDFFARKTERDLCGSVMEAHNKCTQGTEKLLYYLGQMVNYPYDFQRLIYCSQLVQADCIRSDAEHMRRSRGRCMGSAYWQVNDSNPVISWSSIDYFGRWKALHYAARRFYAPILLSCDDTDPMHPVLAVTNDTRQAESLQVECRLRDHTGKILKSFAASVTVPALSAAPVLRPDLEDLLSSRQDRSRCYLEYTLRKEQQPLSAGTTLFVRPKSFDFLPARVSAQVRENADSILVTLSSDCFAKSVYLSLEKTDCVFSDNWFDLHGDEPVTLTVSKDEIKLTPEEFRSQLKITHYFPARD